MEKIFIYVSADFLIEAFSNYRIINTTFGTFEL
jgi:hypothetical protein